MAAVTLRLEAYTLRARALVAAAQTLADERGQPAVEPLHLLHRLTETSRRARGALRAAGAEPDTLLLEAELGLRRLPGGQKALAHLSPALLALLNRAEGEAARASGANVGVEQLLIALAQEPVGAVRELLAAANLSASRLREAVASVPTEPAAPSTGEQALGRYGRDLTELAAQGRLDPCVGRDAELKRVMQVLARREANNPLLLGEPGVGRSAMVRGLCQRIARGEVPLGLRGKRIVELDLGLLAAGTRLRGDVTVRLGQVLGAVRDAGGEVLLYLRDLEPLLSELAPDTASGLLARALRDGELRIIASGEPVAMRRALGQAPELQRHFSTIEVEPPSVEQTLAILRGLVTRFEADHRLAITESALQAAASFARRYLPGAQLPRAAVDLMDEAAALVRVESELAAVMAAGAAPALAANATADAELRVASAQEDAVTRELPAIPAPITVTEADVARVVADWTGIPVARMLQSEAVKLLAMEQQLAARVLGQERAVASVSKAVRRGRVGLRDPHRPIGSFLFLGSSGVGKTELAKALAEFLFDDEAALIRLDMSEFMEKHTVARLLGSPPGYVDSDAGGFLTEAVRKKPYSVLLFDEIEKAHPDVFNILLQVLDDGRLTDSRGRLAHFADTVIVLTSNLGSRRILEHQGSAEELRDALHDILLETLRPEFLNRLEEVIVFEPLSLEALDKIAQIQLGRLARQLSDRQLSLHVDPAARQELVTRSYDPHFGARPLGRVLRRELSDPLAEELLRGGYRAGDSLTVRFADGRFVFDHHTGSSGS